LNRYLSIKTIDNTTKGHCQKNTHTIYSTSRIPRGTRIRSACVPAIIYSEYSKLKDVVFEPQQMHDYQITLDITELPKYIENETKQLYTQIIHEEKKTRHKTALQSKFYPDPHISDNYVFYVNTCAYDTSRSRVKFTNSSRCMNCEFDGADLIFFKALQADREVIAYYGNGWSTYNLKKHCKICPHVMVNIYLSLT
jgi:hypothetical protein